MRPHYGRDCSLGSGSLQTKSSNLITWEPNFLSKFWLQIWNQGPWKHSEKVLPYFSHAFLVVPKFWVFSMHPKVSRIGCLWINCVPSVTLMLHVLDRFVKKKNQGPTMSFYGRLDLERVCPCDNFSKFPTIVERFLMNIWQRFWWDQIEETKRSQLVHFSYF